MPKICVSFVIHNHKKNVFFISKSHLWCSKYFYATIKEKKDINEALAYIYNMKIKRVFTYDQIISFVCER